MGRMTVIEHDSPLGRWTRALCVPAPPLAQHVEVFWHVAGRASYARDRRLPSGRAHLLFNLGTPALLFSREPDAAPRSFPTCWIAGQAESFIETGSHGDTVLLGVQFRSHGAWRLLRAAQYELADQVVELEALLGDRVLSLRQRLLDAPTPAARFALLEHWLLGLLERGAAVHAAVAAASRAIDAAHGRVDLQRLSRDLGWSRAQLGRRFREQVGLAPKTYSGIVRFNRALALARASGASWAAVADACGYYDQSHLIRDFRRFAGRAPDRLLDDARPDAGSVVIA
jgi:AraC-like DNA-binding protein